MSLNEGQVLNKAFHSPLVSANSATAAAADNNIATTGFVHISMKNDDSSNSITFAVDEDSTAATKPIVVNAGESFDDYITGTALHYSAASGSPSFRYALR